MHSKRCITYKITNTRLRRWPKTHEQQQQRKILKKGKKNNWSGGSSSSRNNNNKINNKTRRCSRSSSNYNNNNTCSNSSNINNNTRPPKATLQNDWPIFLRSPEVVGPEFLPTHASEDVVEDVEVALPGPLLNHPWLLQQVVRQDGCNKTTVCTRGVSTRGVSR